MTFVSKYVDLTSFSKNYLLLPLFICDLVYLSMHIRIPLVFPHIVLCTKRFNDQIKLGMTAVGYYNGDYCFAVLHENATEN
jgi:hypothetical protein